MYYRTKKGIIKKGSIRIRNKEEVVLEHVESGEEIGESLPKAVKNTHHLSSYQNPLLHGAHGVPQVDTGEVEDCTSGIKIDGGVENIGPIVSLAQEKEFDINQGGLSISNSFGPLLRNKKNGAIKKGKSSSLSTSAENEASKGVIVGMVNEEARRLIPSISITNGDQGESQFHVSTRRPLGAALSVSSNCDDIGAAIGDVSIGDSGIRICNERFLVDHELSLANKVWSFAKDNLGVTGKGNEVEYVGKICSLEARDQNAKGRKGKKNSSR